MMRFPPKTILVPIDFTEASMAGWQQAKALARRFKARLEAAYCEDLLPAGDLWGMARTRLTPETRAEILRHLRRRLGTGFKVHIAEGDPLVAILRLARTRKPDLIVMGTHARTGFDRLWAGSVTESVVRLSPVPVLTVHEEKPRLIRRVLAPVHFADYSEFGLDFAAGTAAALGAQLTALHVAGDPADSPNPAFRINGMLARIPESVRKACRARVEVVKGAATEQILTAARRHDLVVLVAHRKALLKDLVLGTTAERVLRHCPVPVLAVPSPRSRFLAPRFLGKAAARS